MRLNPVDLTFAILLAAAAMRGWSKGLVGTVAGYVAPVLAFLMASDWSDPVRERLAAAMPAPDFLLDIAAPLLVFVVVVAGIRLAASITSGLLGVGQSTPSRGVAAVLTALVTGAVLGSLVLVTHEMAPERIDPSQAAHEDSAGQALVGPFEQFVGDMDQRFAESHLAPHLADLASLVVTVAAEHKDEFHLPSPEKIQEVSREAAEAAMKQIPVDDAKRAMEDTAKKVARDVADGATRQVQEQVGAAVKQAQQQAAKTADKAPATHSAARPSPGTK